MKVENTILVIRETVDERLRPREPRRQRLQLLLRARCSRSSRLHEGVYLVNYSESHRSKSDARGDVRESVPGHIVCASRKGRYSEPWKQAMVMRILTAREN